MSGQQEQRGEGDDLRHSGFINPVWMTAENQMPQGNGPPALG